MSTLLVNGSFKPKSSEVGMAGVGKEITQSYFAIEIRESARHLSGNKNCSRGSEERASANKPRCQFLGSGQVV